MAEAPSVTPGIIRRVIEAGLRRGFDPADRSTSVHLSPQEVLEAVYSYPHPLRVGSENYAWTPVFKGGLHLWIRSAAAPQGQLLATMTDLKVEHLTDRLASAFISLALRSGWQPLHHGADCHWLDQASCRRILEELFPATGTTPPHSHISHSRPAL